MTLFFHAPLPMLEEPFATLWRGQDVFMAVERLQGTEFRSLANRRTLRTEVAGAAFFVKIHRGVGWWEIFKNLLTGKRPVLGARDEWQALKALAAAGVPSMEAVAFGERGANPARRHSFLITRALEPAVDLEALTQHWAVSPPPPAQKRALITALARQVRTMHRAGINHRDCYLCHFLLHGDAPKAVSPQLSVIDLHRAQIRPRVPRRWRDKDLAALWFSAQEVGLTRRDLLRFLRDYLERSPRAILREEASLIARLARKAEKLAARKRRYGDAL
ncbi:MAG: lipopolysaccharide core heptose(I) kinase RfaP [Zoogloeaceae bacterium]|jgi:heptose I phosphotransferase|nr:lipopolysaccharide core heptose(I) kinase RfaP [Zoogloeaceae bacterium]